MKSLKKALTLLLSAMIMFTSVPFTAIGVFAAEDDTITCYECGGTGLVDCEACQGTGMLSVDCAACENGQVATDCSVCNGTGMVEDPETGEMVPCTAENCQDGKVYSECADCQGTGTVSEDCPACNAGKITCSKCNGTGIITLVEDPAFQFSDVNDQGQYIVTYAPGFTFTMTAASTNNPDGKVSYVSNDPSVATIDPKTGLVTVQKAGKTELVATIESDGKTYKTTEATCELLVEKATPTVRLIAPANGVLTCGDIFPLVVISDSINQGDVEFSVESGSDYIELDEKGKTVTAKAATPDNTKVKITAEIKAFDDNYNDATASVELSVAKATANNFVFANKNPYDLSVGETLDNPVLFNGADNADVQYEIVAGSESASLKGSVLTAESGPATVTVRATISGNDMYNDAVAEYTVNIKSDDTSVSAFANSAAQISIPYGTAFSNPAFFPNAAADASIVYDSANPEVAKVDASGAVTTVKPGQTTISAECNGIKLSYLLTVSKADQSDFAFEQSTSLVGYGDTYQFKTVGGDPTQAVEFKSSDASLAEITADGTLTAKKLSADAAVVITASKPGNEYYNPVSVTQQVVIGKKVYTPAINPLNETSEVPYSPEDTYALSLTEALPDDITSQPQFKIIAGDKYAEIVNGNAIQTIEPGEVTVQCIILSDLYEIAPVTYTFTIVKADREFSFATEEVNLEYGMTLNNPVQHDQFLEDADIAYSVDKVDGAQDNPVESVENGQVKFKNKTIGQAKITASVKETECYNAATASYIVTVSYAQKPSDAGKGNDYILNPVLGEDETWYNGQSAPNGVTIQAPAGYQISEDNSLDTTWGDSISISEDGEHQKTIYLKNQNGGITDSIQLPLIKLDKTAPTAPEIEISEGTSLKDKIKSLFFGQKVNVTFTSSDETSGVAYFEYCIQEGGVQTTTTIEAKNGEATRSFDGDTELTVLWVLAVDNAGNRSACKQGDGTIIVVDNTSPIITASYSESSNTIYGDDSQPEKLYYGSNTVTEEIQIAFTFDEKNFYAEDINKKDEYGNLIDNGCSIKLSVNGGEAEPVAVEVDEIDSHKLICTIPMDKDNHLNDGEYVFYVNYKDRSGNSASYTSPVIIVDTINPEIMVQYNLSAVTDVVDGKAVPRTDAEGFTYYMTEDQTSFCVSYLISEKNFSEDDFQFTGKGTTFKASEDEESNVVADTFTVEWKPDEELDTYVASVSFTNEARYTFSADFQDLAGNEAVLSTAEDSAIPLKDNKIVYDNAATTPEITIEYEKPSIAQFVLQGITFGIYKAETDVIVTVKDNVSAIYSFGYGAELEENASAINSRVEKVTHSVSDEDFDTYLVNENPGCVQAEFAIPPQFRGFVYAEAQSYSTTSTSTNEKDTVLDDTTGVGVIVDAVAPVGSLEISQPNFILDENGDKVSFDENSLKGILNHDESDNYRFVYTDHASITVYIQEANFNTQPEMKDTVVPTDKTKILVNDVEQLVKWEKVADKEDCYKADITISGEGYYTVTIQATDIANNTMDPLVKHIAIDKFAPEITSFQLTTSGEYYYKDEIVGNPTESGKEPADDVSFNQYDYYFKESVEIRVSTTGAVQDANSASCVANIILLTQDFTQGAEEWVVHNPSSTTANGVEMTSTFTIEGPFKGNIFAIPIDKLGHYPYDAEVAAGADVENDWETCNDYMPFIQYVLKDNTNLIELLSANGLNIGAAFVAPNDTIIENDNKHKDHSDIQIAINQTADETERTKDCLVDESRIQTYTQNIMRDQVVDFDNASGQQVPLFNENVDVTLTVSDLYSGIRSVEWYVLGRDGQDTANNQQGVLTIDNDGMLSPSDSDWQVVTPPEGDSNTTRDNLVYKVQRTVTVQNNSNDIIILVVLTDRAGNKTYDYNVIGIDKTNPVVTMTYADRDQRTGQYDAFFNHTRVATISVKERNFDTKYISYTLENVDPAYQYVPNVQNIFNTDAWTSNGDPNDPVYTYTISYTSDGIFNFKLGLTDVAGNVSNTVSSSFTVDLIAPRISVALDLNDVVQNGKYFNQTRTATITVTEHNFSQNEFENLLQASLNGVSMAAPRVSGFRNTGTDRWTATVTFASDGDYVLNFRYTDKAGNAYTAIRNDYTGIAATEFTVDKTAPVIDVVVNDQYAYIEGPIVRVVESDNNCSDVTTSMTGTVYQDGAFSTVRMNHSNGTMRQDHHYADFTVTYEQVMQDGYYTVEASSVDMAGNRSNTVTKVFTKNEYGAVYTLSSDLAAAVKDAYVNKDKYFSNNRGNIYIDEYSPTPILEENAEFYININSKRQDNCITRQEMGVSNGWYVYRYTIDNSKLVAEGLYALYIRSTSVTNAGSVINNDANADKAHRLDVRFTVDNTNPYVRISGLENHITNRTSQKDIKLSVSDNNLYLIRALIEKANGEKTTYVWVRDPDAYQKQDPNEIVSSFLADGAADASVVEVSFPLALSDSENSAQYNVQLEIVDMAGNYAKNADDYNKDEMFTDAYGRLNYLFDTSSSDETAGMNYLEFTEITLSKNFAVVQMIRDNQPTAIAIFVALALLLFVIIVVPILVKRRKKFDAEDRKEIE